MNQKIIEIVNKLDQAKVMIVGDLMLDRYVFGETERISPEAPVQIVDAKNEEDYPGGASNVARNIASFGGNVLMVGIVGSDNTGERLKKLLSKNNIKSNLVVSEDRRTTLKNRVISQNQQLLRVDYEDREPLTSIEIKSLEKAILESSKDYDYIIVSDYAKGVINQKIYDYLTTLGKKIIVDPKPRMGLVYHDAFLITPNIKEAALLSGLDKNENAQAIAKSIKQITNGNVLLTLGAKGMYLYFDSANEIIPTHARQVYDVSGAGDTVVSVCAAALSVGADLDVAAKIANYAAGIVVGRVGTAVTTKQELLEFISESESTNLTAF